MNTLKLVHGRNKATTCDIFQYGATVISGKVIYSVIQSFIQYWYLVNIWDDAFVFVVLYLM